MENPTELVAMRTFPAGNSLPGMGLPQFPCGCSGVGKGKEPGGFTSGPSHFNQVGLRDLLFGCLGLCF